MYFSGFFCASCSVSALNILITAFLHIKLYDSREIKPKLLVLIGIVFVIETLSCIIQVVYYHFTKKRLFLMTPIHHSFEKKGWKENDIVKLFWIAGLIASLMAI